MGKYIVWSESKEQTEDDGKAFEAVGAWDAAEQWAQWDDHYSADFSIVGGQPADVVVRDVETRAIDRFVVSGEQSAVYTASLRCSK